MSKKRIDVSTLPRTNPNPQPGYLVDKCRDLIDRFEEQEFTRWTLLAAMKEEYPELHEYPNLGNRVRELLYHLQRKGEIAVVRPGSAGYRREPAVYRNKGVLR